MWAELRPALIIARREIKDQLRDWRIVFPVIFLTMLFPGLMNFTAEQVLDFVRKYGANLLAIRFVPFLMMIVGFFPITISLVIALESFAGETERHSIEPLLSSPLKDWQLYLGKLLASLLPSLAASYIAVVVYAIGVYRSIHWSAEPGLLFLIFVLTAVQALVMVSGAVVISTQTTSVRAANLLASFIIIPMAFLIQGESVMMLWADYKALWWAVLGQVILAGLLVRMGITHFSREGLLGREIDTINLRWVWKVFRREFVGQAHSFGQWLGGEVPAALRRLALPSACMVGLLAASVWLGVYVQDISGLTAADLNLDKLHLLGDGSLLELSQGGFFSAAAAGILWLHNLRAIAIAALLGVFSFGVAGALVAMLPMVVIGFLTNAASQIGISPVLFTTAFFLPHAVLELPAIILSGAAILRVGATFVSPSHNETIGEAWIRAMADLVKVGLAVILPLLLGAAFLEVYVTPRVAVMLLGG